MEKNRTNRMLRPRRALIIYHNDRRDDFYVESREIKFISGRNQLGSAVPLADNILKDVAKSYMKTNSVNMEHEPLIGSHLLYAVNQPGRTAVIWYRPAMKRNLNFSEWLKIEGDAEVMVPATLYLVMNTKMYVFALAGDDRPTLDTKLFYAPFFNVYGDGNICLGTAAVGKQKAKTFEKEAERFERGFYMAEQNNGQSDHLCKTPLSKLWAGLIESRKPFPVKELIQHKEHKTLRLLINHLIGNKNEE